VPTHVRVYVNEPGPVRAPVDWEPLSGFTPDQESKARHAVVFVVLQVKVDDPPDDIEVGLAERLTVGGGGGGGGGGADTLTVTDLLSLPLGPMQVRV